MPIEAILIAVGAAIWKLFKELPEIFSGRNKSLREEAEFADKFFARLNESSLLPFVEEKGFQALARSRTVSAREIKHVLSIRSCPQLVRDYVAGRSYLEFINEQDCSFLRFKKKYRSSISRKARKILYFFFYVGSFILAICPLIWAGFFSGLKSLPYLFSISPIFLVLAYFSVDEGLNIKCAEEVMNAQAQILR